MRDGRGQKAGGGRGGEGTIEGLPGGGWGTEYQVVACG